VKLIFSFALFLGLFFHLLNLLDDLFREGVNVEPLAFSFAFLALPTSAILTSTSASASASTTTFASLPLASIVSVIFLFVFRRLARATLFIFFIVFIKVEGL